MTLYSGRRQHIDPTNSPLLHNYIRFDNSIIMNGYPTKYSLARERDALKKTADFLNQIAGACCYIGCRKIAQSPQKIIRALVFHKSHLLNESDVPLLARRKKHTDNLRQI